MALNNLIENENFVKAISRMNTQMGEWIGRI